MASEKFLVTFSLWWPEMCRPKLSWKHNSASLGCLLPWCQEFVWKPIESYSSSLGRWISRRNNVFDTVGMQVEVRDVNVCGKTTSSRTENAIFSRWTEKISKILYQMKIVVGYPTSGTRRRDGGAPVFGVLYSIRRSSTRTSEYRFYLSLILILIWSHSLIFDWFIRLTS